MNRLLTLRTTILCDPALRNSQSSAIPEQDQRRDRFNGELAKANIFVTEAGIALDRSNKV
jgi:hypothetical protein